MPTGILQTVASYVCNGGVFLTAKYFPAKQLRTAWVMFGIIVGMISAVFLYVLPLDNYNGRLAALYCSYFYLGPYIVSLGIAPQFFKADQAPLYPLGMGAVLGSYVLSIITIAMYATYCWYENRRRDRIDSDKGGRVHADTDFRDLTDKQNVHFRYVW